MRSPTQRLILWWLLFGAVFPLGLAAQTQPTVLSSVPANGAIGVSTTSNVVFTFNVPMNAGFTTASFFNGFTQLAASSSWNANNTVLSCTPTPPFPPNTVISWSVFGQGTNGLFFTNFITGYFVTGSGSSGGGGATNTTSISFYSVGINNVYYQTSSAPSYLYPPDPYNFVATAIVASSFTASAATLTLPTSAVANLSQNAYLPWTFSTFGYNTNLGQFNATYPTGIYTFNLQSVPSSSPVMVDFPSTLPQPPAPHVSNFDAAQSVDPTLPFILRWDPFVGGTTTNDAVTLALTELTGLGTTNPGATTIVESPVNGFPGTTTSFLFPAYTLSPSTNYAISLNFYHFQYAPNGNTGGTTNLTQAFRVSNLNLVLTTIVDTNLISLGGASFDGNTVGFAVFAFPGANITIEYNTTLSADGWQVLYATNSPGYKFTVNASPGTNKSMFFRASTGP